MAQFVRRIGKDITAREYARLRGQSWPNAWQDLRNFPDTMAFIRMLLFFSNGIGSERQSLYRFCSPLFCCTRVAAKRFQKNFRQNTR
jgi:hypothetical protein